MFKNLTPHPVKIHMSQDIVMTIYPVGLARVQSMGKLIKTVDGVKIYRTEFGETYGLPDPEEGTLYIVSRMVLDANPLRTDLVCPTDMVRDVDGNVIGCRALSV